jgi:hypothetical protein
MDFIYTHRLSHYYARLLLGIVLIAGCRAEQVVVEFQPARLKVPQDSFVLSKSKPVPFITQKRSELFVVKRLLTGTHSQRKEPGFVGMPKTMHKQTRINRLIVKRNNGHSAARKKKYGKPSDSLHGLGVFLVIIGIVLSVLFIAALISGSTLFSILAGILLLLYLALIISNSSGG